VPPATPPCRLLGKRPEDLGDTQYHRPNPLRCTCPRSIYSIAINRVHVHECVALTHLQLPMELLGLLAAARRIAFSGQLHSHMHYEREPDFWVLAFLTANRHRKEQPSTSAHYRVAAGGTGIAQEGRTPTIRALSQQHLDRPTQVQDGVNKRHAHLRVTGSARTSGVFVTGKEMSLIVWRLFGEGVDGPTPPACSSLSSSSSSSCKGLTNLCHAKMIRHGLKANGM
jgi:hypothetical protein